MLAASNREKDVILTLIQRGANLDLVDAVSVHVDILHYKAWSSSFWAYPDCYYNFLYTLNYLEFIQLLI